MNIPANGIKAFQNRVFRFYKERGRGLPWRKTSDPYRILVSEIMLQQTQVDRVRSYYLDWLKKWPTVERLARADRTAVLKMWMGLGYNTRAINLRKTAQKIVKEHDGNVIQALQDYKNLPGIGPYTAAAVQIFAQNKDMITVDTNIRRILIHEFSLPETINDHELWALAERCLPEGKSRDWHNALMDYGATLMTARRTGIKPKTRQGRFEGSDRQARARILRHLLRHRRSSLAGLQKSAQAEKGRLQRILGRMVAHGVIRKQAGRYRV